MRKTHRAVLMLILILAATLWIFIDGTANRADGNDDVVQDPVAVESSSAPTPSPAAAATPAPTAVPLYQGVFELPIDGATGFATIELNLRSAPQKEATLIQQLKPGEAFRIIAEEGDYWRVELDGKDGYLAHRYCMINLPDVIPSIVYDATNASASKVISSGKPLPGITGQKLYEARFYNARLDRQEYIMPVLYTMAKKIAAAERAALSEGNALKIYEAYRPYHVQRVIVDALTSLAEKDADVMRGISTPPWGMSWFAAQGVSNHQRGCAIDVGLVRVERLETAQAGGYAYRRVADYAEYDMPTPIHELSAASVTFAEPVIATSSTAWKQAKLAPSMNKPALMLQGYCTGAGLTPLASEWWHFNDLEAYERIQNNPGRGESTLTELLSVAPGANS